MTREKEEGEIEWVLMYRIESGRKRRRRREIGVSVKTGFEIPTI